MNGCGKNSLRRAKAVLNSELMGTVDNIAATILMFKLRDTFKSSGSACISTTIYSYRAVCAIVPCLHAHNAAQQLCPPWKGASHVAPFAFISNPVAEHIDSCSSISNQRHSPSCDYSARVNPCESTECSESPSSSSSPSLAYGPLERATTGTISTPACTSGS